MRVACVETMFTAAEMEIVTHPVHFHAAETGFHAAEVGFHAVETGFHAVETEVSTHPAYRGVRFMATRACA